MVTYSSYLFLDIFCVYTQSSDVMGLIFHAKLTACFISNVYYVFSKKKKKKKKERKKSPWNEHKIIDAKMKQKNNDSGIQFDKKQNDDKL